MCYYRCYWYLSHQAHSADQKHSGQHLSWRPTVTSGEVRNGSSVSIGYSLPSIHRVKCRNREWDRGVPHFALMGMSVKCRPFKNIIKNSFQNREIYCNSCCKVDTSFIKHPCFIPTYFKALHSISFCLSSSSLSRLITILSSNYNFFLSFLFFKNGTFTLFLLQLSSAKLLHSLAWNTVIMF